MDSDVQVESWLSATGIRGEAGMETLFNLLIGAYLGVGVIACVFSLIGLFVIPTRPQPGDPRENCARLPWREAPTGLGGLRARSVCAGRADAARRLADSVAPPDLRKSRWW